jgi:hypothetical protein
MDNHHCNWGPTALLFENKYKTLLAVFFIRDVYTGSRIRIFPSQIQDQNDPGSESASKNLSIFLTQKTVSKLSEK